MKINVIVIRNGVRMKIIRDKKDQRRYNANITVISYKCSNVFSFLVSFIQILVSRFRQVFNEIKSKANESNHTLTLFIKKHVI